MIEYPVSFVGLPIGNREDITRRALTVELESCTVELALDSGVLLGSGRELPLCEVEVELKRLILLIMVLELFLIKRFLVLLEKMKF